MNDTHFEALMWLLPAVYADWPGIQGKMPERFRGDFTPEQFNEAYRIYLEINNKSMDTIRPDCAGCLRNILRSLTKAYFWYANEKDRKQNT